MNKDWADATWKDYIIVGLVAGFPWYMLIGSIAYIWISEGRIVWP